MVNTRSNEELRDADVPSLDDLEAIERKKAHATGKKTGKTKKAPQKADRGAASNDHEGSGSQGMPGEFSPHAAKERESADTQTDEDEEDWVDDEVAPVGEELEQREHGFSDPSPGGIDAEQRRGNPSDPVTPRASSEQRGGTPSDPDAQEQRTDTQGTIPGGQRPSTGWTSRIYPDESRRESPGRLVSPSFDANAEATLRHTLGAPFQTPNRTARTLVRKPAEMPSGSRYFPSILNIENTYVPETDNAPTEQEQDTRSDETLRQAPQNARKSKQQQRAEDMAHLQALISDRERLQYFKSVLPDIIPNEKSLLTEIKEVMSSDEYDMSAWGSEIEIDDDQDEGLAEGRASNAPKTNKAGPSYIEKGKWQCDTDHDAQQEYKREKAEANAEAERIRKKSRPRPSLGVTLDDIRPPVGRSVKILAKPTPNPNSSMAALPAGGYFASKMRTRDTEPEATHTRAETTKKGHHDTSDSSDPDTSAGFDSDTSSSSGGKSKKERKREKYRKKNLKYKREIQRLKRAGYKVELPKAYRGQEDYDEFEQWDYEVDRWLADTGFKGKAAVRHIGSFLRDKAGRWYMDFVAPEPEKYTVDSLKMALFNYFFPIDLKAKLRRDFHRARQGDQRIIDYVRALRRLQKRIPDITDRQICIKLWQTVHTYIRVKWTDAGMNSEDTELDELCETAQRYEASERIQKNWNQGQAPPNSRNNQRGGYNGKRRNEWRRNDDESSAPKASGSGQKDQKDQKENKNTNTSDKPRQNRDRPKGDKLKLSREERNELRAAGKCFNCKEPGHTLKDCPKRNTAKPTGLYSSALQYARIEELRKERDQSYLSVASIRPDRGSSSPSTLQHISAGDSLLDAILDEITPYSRIVIAEDVLLRVTDDKSRTVVMKYTEIAERVREMYIEANKRRAHIDNENNPGTQSELKEEAPDDQDEESSTATAKPRRYPEENLLIELNTLRVQGGKRGEGSTKVVERNTSKPKDITRKLPKPLVVEAQINGHKVRALIDSGSLGDFISTTVVDQLKLKRETLAKPIGLQLAVTGSRSMINYSVMARLRYQDVDCMRHFDVINLDNYDVILGTPFLYQHKVIISVNPPGISIGSPDPLPIQGELCLEIESLAAELMSLDVRKLTADPTRLRS